MLSYRVIIEPDGKKFHGYVPTLKGCHTWGKSITETRKHLQEAIEVYLETLIDQGDPIPLDNGFEFVQIVSLPEKTITKTKAKKQYA